MEALSPNWPCGRIYPYRYPRETDYVAWFLPQGSWQITLSSMEGPKVGRERSQEEEMSLARARSEKGTGLPELQLVELRRSRQPINREANRNKTLPVETIKPWNNYTIVMLEDSERIAIYDEKMEIVPGFRDSSLSSKKVFVPWDEYKIKNKLDTSKTFIGSAGSQNSNVQPLSALPPELRGFAKSAIKDNQGPFKWSSSYTKKEFFVSNVIVVDKYVLSMTEEGGYFAYVTQDEDGIILPPQDWQRINPTDPVPPELNKCAERILGGSEGYKQLNEKYSVSINDVGINIVKNEEVKGTPVFSDIIPSVDTNIVVDPINPSVVYYCQSSSPRNVKSVNLSAEPSTWSPVSAELPQKYDEIHNLQLDPSGNFFLFYSKEDLVIITRDGLEEVKRIPRLTHVNFDASGNIRAVDENGFLVVFEPHFEDVAQEIERRRMARLAEGIQLQDIFNLKTNKNKKDEENLKGLEPLRAKYQEQFGEVLAKITTREGVQQLRQGFNKLRDQLRQNGLKPNEITFIIEGLETSITEKEKQFATKETQDVLAFVRTRLAGSLSIASIAEARAGIEKIRSAEALLETGLRQEFREVAQELEQKSLEFFHQRGGEVIKEVRGLLERTKTDLEAFTSKTQMDDWLEFRYPQLKSRLGLLAHDVPLEADEAYNAIVSVRNELQKLATQFEDKFKREYAQVREKAVERIEGTVDTLETDIEGLLDRLRSKGFADRRAAEQYLDSSEARKTLEAEITALTANNPDIAKELERALKVRLSNALTEIERGGMTQVAETGQQMVLIGETYFPKWEAKVKEKGERKVDLVFAEDIKSHGPGVKAGDILGDVSLNITTSTGKIKNVRPYEGWKDENEWRLGLVSYRGEEIPPSYVTASQYKTIRRDYSNWSKGEQSQLQKELQEKRDTLKEIYSRRQKAGKRTPEVDEAWKQEYQAKLSEYGAFVAEHHIVLLKRIDRIKSEPEIEYTNGKGFVPEWQGHWVNDPQTARDLEEMAKSFKMQMDLQEGLLNLKGHAGTGKDVRIKMFCALTNRPYFSIDGTKWTTEFELSEDVVLESKEGASQTVKVPSAVLNGITTPGAVVYFNEFNAMPEQAQIFLHALMDEKRSLTLKTSSGKVVRAHPSVLLASSMNPGYPGTFDPQFATRSRMVSLEIGYPPLTRKPDIGDLNPNAPIDASEALRIAREVDSLSDLTYEASLERNEFVKMWDKYVNGIDNGSPDPNSTQKFDIDASLALVQFANKLRDNFIKIFEKSRDVRNALPVSQPVTGRELRRCAYELSKMSPEEKATANPEAVARHLLAKYLLTHIDKKEDQDKIKTAMNTWTSAKRIRA